MSALDFPASPTLGQNFVGGNGVQYQWNGSLWVSQGSTTSPGGDFMARNAGAPALSGGAAAQIIIPTVITGNSGGWYSTSTGRYTPPAGRFVIRVSGIGYVTSGAGPYIFSITLRKNGVDIQSGNDAAALNVYAFVAAEVLVDANGTDYFEMWGNSGTGNNQFYSATFQAFPISGVKGPMGDLPGGLKLYSEQVLSTAGNALQVSFPLGAKLVRLEWHAKTTGLTNGAIVLRGTVGGVVNTSAIYHSSDIVQAAGTVTGQFLTSQTGWAFHNAAAHTWGSAVFLVPRLGTGTADYGLRTNAAGRNRVASGLETNDSLVFDGYHLGIGTTTWDIGSYLRAYVVV